MTKILIIQSQVKHYRIPFYTQLHEALAEVGMTLRVVYSEPNKIEELRSDNAELPAEFGVAVPSQWILGRRIQYQSLFKHLLWADFVIVEQASRLVMNYVLVAARILKLKRFGYWGHGRNLQSNKSGIAEAVKKTLLNHCDWWFAYTSGTKDYLTANGVVDNKITVVRNSTDTRSFRQAVESQDADEIAAFRSSLGIDAKGTVALFCGSLYENKMIPFLADCVSSITKSYPNFRLLIVGDGLDRDKALSAAAADPAIHYFGPKFGDEVTPLFAASDLFLCPGLVGLAILDSFAAGLPLLSMNLSIHSPEIEYLEDGYNGLITAPNKAAYTQAIVNVIEDKAMFEKLRTGARESAKEYSIETMVANFRDGILAATQ